MIYNLFPWSANWDSLNKYNNAIKDDDNDGSFITLDYHFIMHKYEFKYSLSLQLTILYPNRMP